MTITNWSQAEDALFTPRARRPSIRTLKDRLPHRSGPEIGQRRATLVGIRRYVRSAKPVSSRDWSTEEGAKALAELIEAYHGGKAGCEVAPALLQRHANDTGAERFWIVRSNLVNGLPRSPHV